jgi:Flp pilus assembly protein CpaB
MERKRAFLIASIFLGISIALISAYSDALRSQLTKDFGAEIGVVVAKESIPEYAIIRSEMLEVVPIFKNFVQTQTVTVAMGDPVAEKKAINEVAGKAAYVPLYAGEQITLTKLVHQDGKPVLDKQVEKKMRAVTVTVSPANGVGRFIRPGNHVDVIAWVRYSSDPAFEVKTMMQNVLVLATGKNLQNSIPTKVTREVLSALEAKFEESRRRDLYTTNVDTGNTKPDDNYTNMTLHLSPEDADKLLFLQHREENNEARLVYVLRNSADTNVANLETTILDQVLGPDSEIGRSKIKFPMAPPAKPKYYDQVGGQNIPRY